MSILKDRQTPGVKYGGQPSEAARLSLEIHQCAVDKAVGRKRRLGQYWVEWDGEKAIEVHPESPEGAATE